MISQIFLGIHVWGLVVFRSHILIEQPCSLTWICTRSQAEHQIPGNLDCKKLATLPKLGCPIKWSICTFHRISSLFLVIVWKISSRNRRPYDQIKRTRRQHGLFLHWWKEVLEIKHTHRTEVCSHWSSSIEGVLCLDHTTTVSSSTLKATLKSTSYWLKLVVTSILKLYSTKRRNTLALNLMAPNGGPPER